MRKVLFCLLMSIGNFASAQQSHPIIEGIAPDLYLTHSVSPKESFYSIGKLYNQQHGSIAAFNKIDLNNGVRIGQALKIPVNNQNFDTTGVGINGIMLVPLQHTVAKGETLFRIAKNHGISVSLLKQMNNMKSDNIEVGQALKFGNLKILQEQVMAFANLYHPAEGGEPYSMNEGVVAKLEIPVKNKRDEPIKTIVDTIIQKPQEVENVQTDTAKKIDQVIKNNEGSRETKVVLQNTAPVVSATMEGAFADYYSSEALTKILSIKNGEAATFKSTSGWHDQKFYVLINEIAPGTIVKITAAEKTIYAKVLGPLPEMKDNNGLLLRISNSAASSLGIIDPKFGVQLSYYQ